MASKKGSKKTAEKVEEAVVEEKVEVVPVEEPAPAPKVEKKVAKKSLKELPEPVGFAGTTEEYLDAVSDVLIGRKTEGRERAYYVKLVDEDGFPLPKIVAEIKRSGEYQGSLEHNEL